MARGAGVDSKDIREERPAVFVPTPCMRPLFEFQAPSRVLVTGGAGFLGSALCSQLRTAGAEVFALDDLSAGGAALAAPIEGVHLRRVDVSRSEEVARVLTEAGPFDVLFHFAAKVGVRAVLDDPEAARIGNEAATAGLLQALSRLPAKERPRLFAASSSEVYRESSGELHEECSLRSVSGVGRWAYAASKVHGERLLDSARGLWPRGLGPVHLRFFNVVGPGQDSARGFVLPRFIEAAKEGRPLCVHGDGRSVRTYAHVDEVAATLARLSAHPTAPEGPLNVGGTARASVLELAEAVKAASSHPVEVDLVDPRDELGAGFEEVRVRTPRLERLASLGCGVPSMSLRALVEDSFQRHTMTSAVEGGATCASRAS